MEFGQGEGILLHQIIVLDLEFASFHKHRFLLLPLVRQVRVLCNPGGELLVSLIVLRKAVEFVEFVELVGGNDLYDVVYVHNEPDVAFTNAHSEEFENVEDLLLVSL